MYDAKCWDYDAAAASTLSSSSVQSTSPPQPNVSLSRVVPPTLYLGQSGFCFGDVFMRVTPTFVWYTRAWAQDVRTLPPHVLHWTRCTASAPSQMTVTTDMTTSRSSSESWIQTRYKDQRQGTWSMTSRPWHTQASRIIYVRAWSYPSSPMCSQWGTPWTYLYARGAQCEHCPGRGRRHAWEVDHADVSVQIERSTHQLLRHRPYHWGTLCNQHTAERPQWQHAVGEDHVFLEEQRTLTPRHIPVCGCDCRSKMSRWPVSLLITTRWRCGCYFAPWRTHIFTYKLANIIFIWFLGYSYFILVIMVDLLPP